MRRKKRQPQRRPPPRLLSVSTNRVCSPVARSLRARAIAPRDTTARRQAAPPYFSFFSRSPTDTLPPDVSTTRGFAIVCEHKQGRGRGGATQRNAEAGCAYMKIQ